MPNNHTPVERLMDLQRGLGNKALRQWLISNVIQTKSQEGKQGDIYEQEAEQVARYVAGSFKADGKIFLRQTAGPVASAAPLISTGRPMPRRDRDYFESRFEKDLSHVRIHTDERASESAAAINANAFTYNTDIYFNKGRYQPGTISGRRLVAHELTHVLQQTDPECRFGPLHASPLNRIHKDDSGLKATQYLSSQSPGAEKIIISVADPAPLARYSELKKVLSADEWQALSNAARARTLALRINSGQTEDMDLISQYKEKGKVEILIPLKEILRPEFSLSCINFKQQLWSLLHESYPDQKAITDLVQQEVLSYWSSDNMGIIEGNVKIALIDPEGEILGPNLLTFQVNDVPVNDIQGVIYAQALDRAGSKTLQQHYQQVARRYQAVGEAAKLDIVGKKAVTKGREYIKKISGNLEKHAFGAVENQGKSIAILLREMNREMKKITEFSQDLAGTYKSLSDFYKNEMQPVVQRAKRFHRSNQPEMTNLEAYEWAGTEVLSWSNKHWDKGNYFRSGAGYAGGFFIAMFEGLGNLFTAGHQETKGQAVKAYRRGLVSLHDMEELIDESFKRSLITGLVMVALTAASFGLSGPVLGTGATIGRSALYWGASGGITSLTSMSVESIYSLTVDFEDPAIRQIWQQRQWSAGQIALGTGVGFGLGAFFGGAGAYVQQNAALSKALVQASQDVNFKPPNLGGGLVVEKVQAGVIRITQQGNPGIIMLDKTGMRVLAPAGTGMLEVARVPLPASLKPGGYLPPSGGAVTGEGLTSMAPVSYGAGQTSPGFASGTGEVFAGEVIPALPGKTISSYAPVYSYEAGAVPGPLSLLESGSPWGHAAGKGPVILEPYVGPSLKSPLNLMESYPGSRVIATEGSIYPGMDDIMTFNKKGGIFYSENQPSGIRVNSIDQISMRFPLPHDKALETLGPQVLGEVNKLTPQYPGLGKFDLYNLAIENLTAQAETLTAYGNYALGRLKPGGSMEVVFWEQSIASEIRALTRQTFVDPVTNETYQLILIDLEKTTQGTAAPYSGFGIKGIGKSTPVYKATLEKVRLPEINFDDLAGGK